MGGVRQESDFRAIRDGEADLCADGLEALLVEVLPELAVGHQKNQI
jgi:hypothetical protein